MRKTFIIIFTVFGMATLAIILQQPSFTKSIALVGSFLFWFILLLPLGIKPKQRGKLAAFVFILSFYGLFIGLLALFILVGGLFTQNTNISVAVHANPVVALALAILGGWLIYNFFKTPQIKAGNSITNKKEETGQNILIRAKGNDCGIKDSRPHGMKNFWNSNSIFDFLKNIVTSNIINLKTMNKKQRFILAVLLPVIVLICALGWAGNVGCLGYADTSCALNWANTWYVWVLALVVITVCEYRLFRD